MPAPLLQPRRAHRYVLREEVPDRRGEPVPAGTEGVVQGFNTSGQLLLRVPETGQWCLLDRDLTERATGRTIGELRAELGF